MDQHSIHDDDHLRSASDRGYGSSDPLVNKLINDLHASGSGGLQNPVYARSVGNAIAKYVKAEVREQVSRATASLRLIG